MGHHVSNVEYDLITVLQSKLEGDTAYDKYIRDCQQEGNDECRQLFEQIQQDDERHVSRLREQVQSMLSQSGAGMQAQTGTTGNWAGSSSK